MSRVPSFSTSELYHALAIELTRADANFTRTQVAVVQASKLDFVHNKIQLDSLPLEIARVELELSLVAINEHWLLHLYRRVRDWFSIESTNFADAKEPRFQFAVIGAANVQVIKCILERDARGRFKARVDEVSDA